jgi:rhamnose transport system permease protein
MKLILKNYRREAVLFVFLMTALLLVGIISPSFISFKTLDAIWHDSVLLLILALVQMPIIISRGIDLSVAANLALTGMLVALLSKVNPSLPVLVLLLAGMGIGAILGAINALLITVLELPPIVATLGTMSVYRGMTYVVSGGQWVNSQDFPPALLEFPNARLLGLTSLEWLSLLALFLAWLLWHQSRFGREIRALGNNPSAARYVGVLEQPRLALLYTIAGAVAGFVSVLWVARYAIASTELAIGFELQVVAACVLGGVSIAGGVGTVYGTALGSLFLVLLYNALPVIKISPFWQTAIVGVAILVAVIVNQSSGKRIGKKILREVNP